MNHTCIHDGATINNKVLAYLRVGICLQHSAKWVGTEIRCSYSEGPTCRLLPAPEQVATQEQLHRTAPVPEHSE